MHRIELRNRGGQVVDAMEDPTLLESLEAAGERVPFACRFGACATCAATLVEGKVDYRGARAVALRTGQHKRGYILTCVAHPRSDCVLEVGVQKGLYRNPFAGR
jgi:ferredoxin